VKISFHLTTVCFLFLFLSALTLRPVYSQQDCIGTWEGTFMNDFKVMLEFEIEENEKLIGSIKMFAGSDVLQDDGLTDIR
jgi:uncharacterized protein YdeI (YjbR/CyaY-like superfamily)